MDYLKSPFNLTPARKQILSLILAFGVMALIIDIFLNELLAQRYLNDQEVTVTHELGTLRARLEERVNTNLFLVHGMAAYISVRSNISQEEFDALASVLLSQSNSLVNIAAAPDFVIRFVHPLAGNEEVLGLDYRNVPDQWPKALEAKETRRMAVAGPLNLVQGGQGLVARVPVFDAGDGRFWGLVSSVIDFNKLLKQAGLQTDDQFLQISMRGVDGTGERGKVFWGDSGLFAGEAGAVTMLVSLPSGSWLMAAVPKGGWPTSHPHLWLIHLAVLSVAVVGCLAGIYRGRNKLALIESEKQLKAMSVASIDALIMIDSQDTILFWNPAAELMFGYTDAEAIGKKFHRLVVGDQERPRAEAGLEMFARTGTGQVLDSIMEMKAVRKSGEIFDVERSVAAFKLRDKWHAIGSVRDITARKKTEELLTAMATLDSLTGLPNRRYFWEQAEMMLRRTIRYEKCFSLVMFDLDHFKRVNDTYGHDAGDKVLQAAGNVAKLALRETDIVGRIGGEEFAAAMPETDLEAARQAAERLRQKLMENEVTTSDGEIVKITASLGIAQLDSRNLSLDDLMKKADEALYEAKRTGRNRVVVFNSMTRGDGPEQQ